MNREVSIRDAQADYLKLVTKEITSFSKWNPYRDFLLERFKPILVVIREDYEGMETFTFKFDPYSWDQKKGFVYVIRNYRDDSYKLWKTSDLENINMISNLSSDTLRSAIDELMVAEVLGK